MSSIGRIARSIFVWSFERGTLQYDIICVLILAFVFFVPPSCFVSKKAQKTPTSYHDDYSPSRHFKTDTRQ